MDSAGVWSLAGFINVGTGGESHLVNVKSGLNARYNQGHHSLHILGFYSSPNKHEGNFVL